MKDNDCNNCPLLGVIQAHHQSYRDELELLRKSQQDLVKSIDKKVSQAFEITVDVASKAAVAAQAVEDAIQAGNESIADKKSQREQRYSYWIRFVTLVLPFLGGILAAMGYYKI